MSRDLFQFCDDLGPAKIVHVYEPKLNLRGIAVVDNVACGPSIGGVRMAKDVTVQECFRLARAMTLKNAAAGLPHGGGKSVIVGDPALPAPEKERIVRAFACALADIHDYILGPDMGTNELCMAWVKDEIGRAVGLPRELGGIPLDELGATGWGLCHSVEVATEYCDVTLAGARVAVQGFGAVGQHSARFLRDKGAVLVATSDSRGAIHDPEGLDVDALVQLKRAGKSVADSKKGARIEGDALLDVACEIWVTAARPDVITPENVDRLRCKIVAEGANISVVEAAEPRLKQRGIVHLPDFIANAGGVICAAMEYAGSSEAAAFAAIAEKISHNTAEVLQKARQRDLLPREAAVALALTRIRRAMTYRRWSGAL